MGQAPWAKSAEYWLYQIHQALLGLTVTIDPGDVEIGAVEIKNGATDDRAIVKTAANFIGTDLALGVRDPLGATEATLGQVQASTGNSETSLASIDTKLNGPLPVKGQGPVNSADRLDVALAWDVVDPHNSGLNIAAAVTLTPPAGANRILIQALTQNVRYTLDGTVPTSTLGFQLKAGNDPVVLFVGFNVILKVIQEAATASLQYQWLD